MNIEKMGGEELRMNAYYYRFDKTVNHEIDKILSAVATAGKMYHNTADWDESVIKDIQDAANKAAERLEAVEKENGELEQAVEELAEYGYGQNLLYETSLENQLKLMKENGELRQQVEDLTKYSDKLAQGLPEGMLPKDIENIKSANVELAKQVEDLKCCGNCKHTYLGQYS